MKNRYIVCYDVCDPKRLRTVRKKMLGFGDPLQFSVFQCDLDRMQRFALLQELGDIISHSEDRIMIINAGPVEGRGSQVVEFLGVDWRPPDKGPSIIV